MAQVDITKLFKTLRGKIGGLVFRHMPDGSIVVSSAPKKGRRRSSKAQKAYRRGTFRDRTQWAKWAYKEYPIYARLAAERPMITAYNLALADISHPPVIQRILVQASDEVMVAKVNVSVSDKHGNLLEWIEAARLEGDWWECVPRVEGKVAAQAWDIPGNRARLELE